jgi:hypothetical protein
MAVSSARSSSGTSQSGITTRTVLAAKIGAADWRRSIHGASLNANHTVPDSKFHPGGVAAHPVLMAVPAAITMAELAATSEQAWSMTITEADDMGDYELVASGMSLGALALWGADRQCDTAHTICHRAVENVRWRTALKGCFA